MNRLDGIAAPLPLPDGIDALVVPGVNGLDMHILEAGDRAHPTVLLLHGFPELGYSWRRIAPELAKSGFHVIAPDQRGYGRTTGWQSAYEADITPFLFTNLVKDMVTLMFAIGKRHVHAVVGHDFGSPAAAWCALIRPDVFHRVVLMSAPFGGPPPVQRSQTTIHADLLRLTPPLKHYQWYYSTPEANGHMLDCEEGVHAFLRAYYHVKSADWPDNHPAPLKKWSAEELARMPAYYVMESDKTMPQTVRPHYPSTSPAWLPDDELAVYASEYERTGFQGGLNWYRASASEQAADTLSVFAGKAIEVPTWFIAGESDWGIYQSPGAIDRMQTSACADFRDMHIVPGAGHWVQQEQPGEVTRLLVAALTP